MKHIHGGDIYRNEVKLDYSANINPLGLPPKVMEALQESLKQVTVYPDVECSRLRQELEKAEGVSKNHIICGNGASDLIFLICNACKPKKALLVAPTFAEYEQALKSINCEIRYYKLEEKKEFSLQEDYLDALTEDMDMVFLCNPNNPTGQVIEREFLIQIARSCKRKNCYLIIDECFLDFLEDPQEYTMKDFLLPYDNLVILKAFTKLYSMPGLRLGYALVGDFSLINRIKQVSQPWNVSVPAQAAGIAALNEKDYVRKTRSIIKQERQFLQNRLQQGLAEKVYESSTNYIFFRAEEGLGEIFRKKGILIRDCSNYKGLEKGYYRIAVRSHAENVELIRVWEVIQ